MTEEGRNQSSLSPKASDATSGYEFLSRKKMDPLKPLFHQHMALLDLLSLLLAFSWHSSFHVN